ncbi:hypothetical protein EK21DRAFT_94266 [Setomelanomma holmii]|uniref:F-box domain-containing protein n=1 Tax=Setomelanomma holmii TaxID=210430 RepID=A0A9P4GYU3_9PLEO|nr:hypothetical protein EK21DRAFT_94266 [Setomelanomma holmii]
MSSLSGHCLPSHMVHTISTMTQSEDMDSASSDIPPENVETILLSLEPLDIVRATQVCTAWRDCINGSSMNTRIITCGNTIREFKDAYLNSLHEKPTAALEEEQEHGKDRHDEEEAKKEDWRQSYCINMYNIRTCFMGIRHNGDVPDGWPIGLRKIHCDLCDEWHSNFRFENLHPLIQFLGDTTMCFRGHGAQLLMSLGMMSEDQAPKSCWEHACQEVLEFAKQISKAYKAIQAGGVGQHQAARPIVTKLTTDGEQTVEDEKGLKLDKVVPLILELFRDHLIVWRNHCHEYSTMSAKVVRSPRAQRDHRATYPTPADWDRHMAG